MPFAADTSPEATRVYFAVLRRLGPSGRVRRWVELTRTMRTILADGIRHRHPEYTDEQVRREVVRRLLGEQLFQLADGRAVGGAHMDGPSEFVARVARSLDAAGI